MYLTRYKINAKIFDQIIYDYEWVVENRDLSIGYKELEEELSKPTANQHTIYYDHNRGIAVIYYLILEGYGLIKSTTHYMRRCIIMRDENTQEGEEIYVVPYAGTCVNYVNKLLYKAGYTDEEIAECLKKCSIDYHAKPKHESVPFYYNCNVIHECHDCVYYDINNAHLDALCEIFSKAKNKFIQLRAKINKLKAQGKYNEARRLKDYINIYCGQLGKHTETGFVETRGTYEWIVQRTRNIMEKALEGIGGTILYVNTDGCIIKDPTHTLATSDKLGEFKSELTGDTVYILSYADPTGLTTGYTLYQYTNAKGQMELKGTMACRLRDEVDLSKGKSVVYKQHRTDKNIVYYDNVQTKEFKIELWQ